jgi:MYXO-CTERM domain-containing protein
VCSEGLCIDGCRDGKACPDGETCTSQDDTIGECVADEDVDPTVYAQGAGLCDCRQAPGSQENQLGLLAALLAAVGLGRRRKRN